MIMKQKLSFGFLLSDVTRLLRKHFDRRAAAHGLTRAQWRALMWLNANEGMHQSELAEQLEVDPMAIGRVIDRLQSSAFVERRADPADRRRWQLFLTARAREVLEDMQHIASKLRSEATSGIAPAELQRTQATLERVKANLLALESGWPPQAGQRSARARRKSAPA
jgi:MarR family transcriptional regulator for hemolysin